MKKFLKMYQNALLNNLFYILFYILCILFVFCSHSITVSQTLVIPATAFLMCPVVLSSTESIQVHLFNVLIIFIHIFFCWLSVPIYRLYFLKIIKNYLKFLYKIILQLNFSKHFIKEGAILTIFILYKNLCTFTK